MHAAGIHQLREYTRIQLGAAMEILAEGGNAPEAPVAAVWVLCVSEPGRSGLGGHTVLLVQRCAGGSRRIISSMLQIISGVIDHGLGIEDAVGAPRLHALASQRLWIESPAATGRLLSSLSGFFRRSKSCRRSA